MSRLAARSDKSEALDLRFKSLAESYCAHLAREKIRRAPYHDPTIPLFKRADAATQQRAIHFLEMALLVFESTIADGKSLRDSRQLMWRTLSHHRLIPDSEFFDHVSDDAIVEVFEIAPPYHIAWNVKLMELVSFTVEQLLTVPLWELGSRPPDVERALVALVARINDAEITTTVQGDIPVHVFQELDSDERLTFELDLVAVSPLRRDGRVAGFISANRSRVIGKL